MPNPAPARGGGLPSRWMPGLEEQTQPHASIRGRHTTYRALARSPVQNRWGDMVLSVAGTGEINRVTLLPRVANYCGRTKGFFCPSLFQKQFCSIPTGAPEISGL